MSASVGTSHFVLGGDCLDRLPDLEPGVANCCVTSPPYWGLRDYDVPPTVWPEIVYWTLGGSVTVPAMECCLGLESTPDAFVGHLVHVFREVRRVLRDDGVLWLNLGDSYASGGRATRATDAKLPKREMDVRHPDPVGIKPKDLLGIPWRAAFALQMDGWWLRQDVIWHKPNPMPESVVDRCTKAHEMVFLLTKSERYYFNSDAIREPAKDWSKGGPGVGIKETQHYGAGNGGNGGLSSLASKYKNGDAPLTRNCRSVWTITTKPYKGAHFATMPPELAETCVLAGCPAKSCPKCGQAWKRIVEKPVMMKVEGSEIDRFGNGQAGVHRKVGQAYQDWRSANPDVTIGFEPSCNCGEPESVPGMVLDPFGGSGTTAGVAKRLGRNSVICELNQSYVNDLIPDRMKRLAGDGPSLF
jgi:DNA modification methylase